MTERQEAFGHPFASAALLQQALTHRSAGPEHNERLEFLGDALLGMIVADHLYRAFPDADEGQLTRARAALVNRDSLATVARDLALGESLVLGEGEMKSGGWRRSSILANALEALIGAVYLDAGMQACTAILSFACLPDGSRRCRSPGCGQGQQNQAAGIPAVASAVPAGVHHNCRGWSCTRSDFHCVLLGP